MGMSRAAFAVVALALAGIVLADFSITLNFSLKQRAAVRLVYSCGTVKGLLEASEAVTSSGLFKGAKVSQDHLKNTYEQSGCKAVEGLLDVWDKEELKELKQ